MCSLWLLSLLTLNCRNSQFLFYFIEVNKYRSISVGILSLLSDTYNNNMSLSVRNKCKCLLNCGDFLVVSVQDSVKDTHCSTFPDMNGKMRENHCAQGQGSNVWCTYPECCWLHNKVEYRCYMLTDFTKQKGF